MQKFVLLWCLSWPQWHNDIWPQLIKNVQIFAIQDFPNMSSTQGNEGDASEAAGCDFSIDWIETLDISKAWFITASLKSVHTLIKSIKLNMYDIPLFIFTNKHWPTSLGDERGVCNTVSQKEKAQNQPVTMISMGHNLLCCQRVRMPVVRNDNQFESWF